MTKALATLLRLRRLDVQAAQRALATTLAAEAAAAAALSQAEAALAQETGALNPAELVPLQNFAAWLPQGTKAQQQAAHELQAAQTTSALARQDLAQHQAALKAAEALSADAASNEARTEARRSAHRLDDLVRSRPR